LRKTVPGLFILCAVAFVFGQTAAAPQKKKAASTPSKTAPTTPSSKKTVTAKKTVSSAKKTVASKKGAKKPAAQAWRPTQRVPTPERYKEIQEALATKGYLEGAGPTGVWDDSSVSALKKFQQDQNLEPSGKIDSLSLIALGLGPKREQPPAPPPAEPKP